MWQNSKYVMHSGVRAQQTNDRDPGHPPPEIPKPDPTHSDGRQNQHGWGSTPGLYAATSNSLPKYPIVHQARNQLSKVGQIRKAHWPSLCVLNICSIAIMKMIIILVMQASLSRGTFAFCTCSSWTDRAHWISNSLTLALWWSFKRCLLRTWVRLISLRARGWFKVC